MLKKNEKKVEKKNWKKSWKYVVQKKFLLKNSKKDPKDNILKVFENIQKYVLERPKFFRTF